MKIRNGFVSNSSSSSFICDYCGYKIMIYEGDNAYDKMVKCENGHTMCRDHFDISENACVIRSCACEVCAIGQWNITVIKSNKDCPNRTQAFDGFKCTALNEKCNQINCPRKSK